MQPDDLACLVDMLESSREAMLYAGNWTGPELEVDRMRLLAIDRLLEIIGEAANRVSDHFQQEHPELPWSQMIATRNRLIHGYRDIDPIVVAQIARTNLPAVISALETIVR
jgi:uncharacterized protein with HEPN domain